MFFLREKKMINGFILIVFFITLDRFLKYLAVNDYFPGGINILGSFFKFNFAGNYNIAFSLPLNGAILNLFIIFIIFGLVSYLLQLVKKEDNMSALLLVAVIFGAMSNLVDRLKFGYVIDYLDLKYFTIFNLADVMIVLGVAGLMLFILDNKKTT